MTRVKINFKCALVGAGARANFRRTAVSHDELHQLEMELMTDEKHENVDGLFVAHDMFGGALRRVCECPD